MNYYNEFDPFAAEWLTQLIKEGLIPNGKVDTRSIVDVQPSDLAGFAQCHFFAGIGGWSYALRIAGWPDNRSVWTGSCPCQPFSVAGKGKGTSDERHLWPEFHRLIRECKPAIVFGEQVASRAGREWFAGVRADLEDVGYGAAAADLCAAGVGAPHIRQRLYWVATNMADATGEQKHEEQQRPSDDETGRRADGVGRRSLDNRQDDMADPEGEQLRGRRSAEASCASRNDGSAPQERQRVRIDVGSDGDGGCGNWSNAEWRRGADGKERRVKPGVCLLANGVPNRVGRLRGYGNAIVPQVAAEVIKPFMGTGVY